MSFTMQSFRKSRTSGKHDKLINDRSRQSLAVQSIKQGVNPALKVIHESFLVSLLQTPN